MTAPNPNGSDANDDTDESPASDGEPGGDEDPDVAAEWMDPADDDILELMRETEVFAPDHIEEEDVCRAPHAAYRCRELVKRGLLKKQAIGMYDITDLGERYLEGEVDPSELEADDE